MGQHLIVAEQLDQIQNNNVGVPLSLVVKIWKKNFSPIICFFNIQINSCYVINSCVLHYTKDSRWKWSRNFLPVLQNENNKSLLKDARKKTRNWVSSKHILGIIKIANGKTSAVKNVCNKKFEVKVWEISVLKS